MVTPSKVQIINSGSDEVLVITALTAGSSMDDFSAPLVVDILAGAGLTPGLKPCPFPDRVEVRLGDLDLTVRSLGSSSILVKGTLLPEPLRRAPELVGLRHDRAVAALVQALRTEDAESHVAQVALHADAINCRLSAGSKTSFRTARGLVVKAQTDDDGQFTGFDVWRRVGRRRVLFMRLYRKDLEIATKPGKAWIREFWRGCTDPVWRIEVVFQRRDLRAAGVRDFTTDAMQQAWRWALEDQVRVVRRTKGGERLIPLWRKLVEENFALPFQDGAGPVVPAGRCMPDEGVIFSQLSNGIAGLGRRAGLSRNVVNRDTRVAIHEELDAVLNRHPGLLQKFEANLIGERRRKALDPPLRLHVQPDGTRVTIQDISFDDALWAQVAPRGLFDDDGADGSAGELQERDVHVPPPSPS